MPDKEFQNIIEDAINHLFRNPTREDNARNGKYKRAFEKFAESGWIPPYSLDLSIPDIVELSNRDAQWIDDYIYSLFTAKHYQKSKLLIKRLKKYRYDNPRYYTCAMILYCKKEYMGCCMMICALIEQTLVHAVGSKGSVSSQAKKSVEKAYENKQTSFGGYGKSPTEYLMIKPLEKVLGAYFKSCEKEPPNINRNFLMHGTAKEKYDHRDCVKLFVILDFLGKLVWEENNDAKPTS